MSSMTKDLDTIGYISHARYTTEIQRLRTDMQERCSRGLGTVVTRHHGLLPTKRGTLPTTPCLGDGTTTVAKRAERSGVAR